MTKAELIHALRDVPDDAEIRTADDLTITGLTFNTDRAPGDTTVVWLSDIEEEA